MSDLELSVVVPVYDSASTLEELVDRLIRVLEARSLSFELILVDDGSADASLEILRRRAAADGRVRAIALTRNFGGQAARCAGFDLVRGRRTVCLDADLENLPEDIPALLAALDRGADLACGVREGRTGPAWRRAASAVLNAYVRRRLGTSVRDLACGMRAMDSRVVHNLAAAGEARRFLTPLLLSRAKHVVEVPIRYQASGRAGGYSPLTLLALAVDLYLLTARRPFVVAGLASAASAAAGGITLLVAFVRCSRWAAAIGLLLAAGGCLGSLLSLVGEYAQRLYELERGAPYYEIAADEPGAGERRQQG